MSEVTSNSVVPPTTANTTTTTTTTRLVSLPPGSDQSEGVHRSHSTPSNATSYTPTMPHFPEAIPSSAPSVFGALSPVVTSSGTLPALPAYRMDITTDFLLPRDVLQHLLKDFFYYIYPLNPI